MASQKAGNEDGNEAEDNASCNEFEILFSRPATGTECGSGTVGGALILSEERAQEMLPQVLITTPALNLDPHPCVLTYIPSYTDCTIPIYIHSHTLLIILFALCAILSRRFSRFLRTILRAFVEPCPLKFSIQVIISLPVIISLLVLTHNYIDPQTYLPVRLLVLKYNYE